MKGSAPYSIVDPPFTLEFTRMSKAELRAYAAWFHETDAERVAELVRIVRGTPGFEGWLPDETPESLDTLGRWFEGQVEMRPKTEDELANDRALLAGLGEQWVEPKTLTDRTASLAMDMGRYFARVMLKAVPEAKWSLRLTGPTKADYGQPTLIGLGPPPLNPVTVMIVTAKHIAAGRSHELLELFAIWRDSLRTPPRKKQAPR
ncbi:MAG: hypothetical protein JNM69_15250 [Archangium sp.]|nr:hypothetical protein [Archangium sp.]